jgi:prepilin-type N-terminal cleavage/methylation domain-containing protein
MMKAKARGFTLLEVMVALTITGFAVGALLSIIGGNKRLAWRSEAALLDVGRVRVELNLAQLADTPGELPRVSRSPSLQLEQDLWLEPPERKTEPGIAALRRYEVRDANGNILSEGVHWTRLGLPE